MACLLVGIFLVHFLGEGFHLLSDHTDASLVGGIQFNNPFFVEADTEDLLGEGNNGRCLACPCRTIE